jgi:hypothetical protein
MTDDNGTQERAAFMERHYTIPELSEAWRISETLLREWFRNEPGVIKHGYTKLRPGKKHTHVILRVPESVAWRMYRRKTK